MHKHEINLDRLEGASVEAIRAAMPETGQMERVTRLFQALADTTRCKIVLALTRHELCVNDIAAVVGASASGVSHHLKGLRDIQVVKFRREGNTIYYSIDDAHVGNLFREAFAHFEHQDRHLPDHNIPPILAPVGETKNL